MEAPAFRVDFIFNLLEEFGVASTMEKFKGGDTVALLDM
jgi:hypothetical protein